MNFAPRHGIALAALCLPLLAEAQPTGSEIPVNTTTTNSQSAPRIAMDGSGRSIVVWQSLDQDGFPGHGIYMRRRDLRPALPGGGGARR